LEAWLLQLVYISSARSLITEEACRDILATSQRNNRDCGVTGLLVAGKRRFLQALEGPTDAVRATYARILADPRHYACVMLSERYVETSQFGEWAMGYSTLRREEPHSDDLTTLVKALVAELPEPNLQAQFIGFADLQSRAA
jgi:Sensors of blue-light using FAD